MSNFQDHPLDESTSVQPQHFDADGYKVGQAHREMTVEHETPPPAAPLGQFPDEEYVEPPSGA